MQRRFNLAPYILFIISGACGLVYEVTWARYLGLFIGHTTLAHMCVLAAFMGGLALGSIWIGRMTGRLQRPLALYGALEIGIGIYAVAYPAIIGPIQGFTLSTAQGLNPGTPAWLGLKLIVSMVALLLPTILMGGTFPALMRHFQPESPTGEDKSEWLYLLNCAGAVIGSLLAGFMLIPQLGMSFTLIGIGAINTVVGLLAVMLAYVESSVAPEKQEAADVEVKQPRHPLAVPVYIAIAVSGLAAMIYELVWIRIFAVTLGSSTYSFTLMLSAFITGIALGSLTVGFVPWLRKNPLLAFALAEIAIGLVVVLSLPMYERLPYIFWRWSSLLSRTAGAFGLLNLMKYLLCFLVMVVPTYFSGMTLPLAIKAIAHRDEQIGKDSGLIYGANTAGTLVGALLTGLVLIKLIGLRHSLEVALMINVLAGGLLVWYTNLPRRQLAAGVSCVLALGLVFAMPKWHQESLVYGTFRQQEESPPTWADFKAACLNMQMHYYHEDDDGAVAIASSPTSQGITLFINGKADATSYSDMCIQTLVGQLPMFFKPDARDVLVVGLGSGCSASGALTHPGTQVDCVEISPAVAEALRYFDDVNGTVRENPNFHLIIEDARSYVLSTPKTYDVVTSEPTNPWIAGVGNLFSKEYYESVDRILKPGGVMAQWLQTYELSDDLVRMVVRTIRSVFPYVYVFEAQNNDYIVLASREPLKPDCAQMEKMLRVPAVNQDLKRISIDSTAALLGRQVLSSEAVRRLVGDQGLINSDEFPLLEYQAPEVQFLGRGAQVFSLIDQRLTRGRELFVHEYLGGKPLDKKTAQSLITAYYDERARNDTLEYALLRYYIAKWPDDPNGLRLFAQFASDVDSSSAAKAVAKLKSMPGNRMTPDMAEEILESDTVNAHSVFTPQDFYEVLGLMDQAIREDPENQLLKAKRSHLLLLAE